MIDHNGKLLTAISDDCKNYDPIKSKPKGVKSVKSGMIFECRNMTVCKGDSEGCGFCINRESLEEGKK